MPMYSETWELGTPKGLWKTVLNSEVIFILRFIAMYWICLGTDVTVLSSQVVPISQVVLKKGFTVYLSQHGSPEFTPTAVGTRKFKYRSPEENNILSSHV